MSITRDELVEALRLHRGEIVEADEWRPLADHVLELARYGILGEPESAFLAAREPPATEQRYWRVKEHPGWHAVEQFYDEQGRLHTKPLSTELRATEADARAEGEATGLPEWTSAAVPVSQGPRYWKIHRAYRTNGNIAWECDGHGKMLCRLTPVCGTHSAGRDTLAEAIADGRASGLPAWQPDAIPAALPTEEKKR